MSKFKVDYDGHDTIYLTIDYNNMPIYIASSIEETEQLIDELKNEIFVYKQMQKVQKENQKQ